MKVYILILLFIYLDGFIPSWKKYIALLVSDNQLETLAGMTELLVCLNDDIQRSFFCWLGGIILLIKCLTSNFVGDVLPAILILNNISKSGIYIFKYIYYKNRKLFSLCLFIWNYSNYFIIFKKRKYSNTRFNSNFDYKNYIN